MADQASFGRPVVPGETVVSNEAVMPGPVSAAPSQFTIANSYMTTDILSMSYQGGEEQTLFAFSPVSPSLQGWSAKNDPQVFTNPGLERGLKNSHVRNGQPTPPPFDDKSVNGVEEVYSLSQYHQPYDGAAYANPTPRASFSQPAVSDAPQPAPKRRKTNGTLDSSSPDSGDKLGEKAKREKFLERNRLAASKCRLKKKKQTETLRDQFKLLSERKDYLTRYIDALRSEILLYKNYLLEHAQCNDEAISMHLSTMVKNITQQDSLGASDLKTDLNTLTPSSSSRTTRSQDLSFGFDSPIQMPSKMGSLEPTPRRDSEQTLASDASFSFSTPNNDAFEDLLDV
ncbi:transcription factor atf21 [Aspergillus awamori]|uniref:Transcription factor atf21 n=1 Tax=Aspergillus awamori TaxID=105351 RepID=A0A401KIQ3_ASPAW|nr:transcription factor atf21 [Aspergillus awamori]